MNLIREEWEELQEAVANKDMVETIDALGDLIYVVMGFGTSCGFNLDRAFNLIHDSNMSKLCDTAKHAQETVEWYKEHRPEFVADYRTTKDGSKWLVYDTLTGKVLKNKYYKAVDLSVLLPSQN